MTIDDGGGFADRTPLDMDNERRAREESQRAEREAAAFTQALKTELAAMRIRHARAVAKVAALERRYSAPRDGIASAFAAMGGGDTTLDNLQMWRVKRDVAAESVRYLEGRLGTVNINDG